MDSDLLGQSISQNIVNKSFPSAYAVETDENNINQVVTLKHLQTKNRYDDGWQSENGTALPKQS